MRAPLSIICWRWGSLFSADYVNTLASMLDRHIRIPFQLWCVTDDLSGIHSRVRVVPLPMEFDGTLRCRRRIWQFAADRRALFGPRILAIDLDVVITDDLTPIVERTEPVCCWRVKYANVYSGSFVMFDAGALDGLYQAYRADPEGYPRKSGERNASDQAMLNYYLRQPGAPAVAEWTEADGFVTYFGDGYKRLEHHGIGPHNPKLPKGARIVVLGSADKAVMDRGAFPWIRDHWR